MAILNKLPIVACILDETTVNLVHRIVNVDRVEGDLVGSYPHEGA